MINNLVPVSEEMLPALADIRTWASSHEDVDASLMSGSGSAVFAMCKSIDGRNARGSAGSEAGLVGSPDNLRSFARDFRSGEIVPARLMRTGAIDRRVLP